MFTALWAHSTVPFTATSAVLPASGRNVTGMFPATATLPCGTYWKPCGKFPGKNNLGRDGMPSPGVGGKNGGNAAVAVKNDGITKGIAEMPYSGAIPEMRLPFCMDSVVEGRGPLIRKRGMPASGLLRLVAPKRENPVNARNPESRPAGKCRGPVPPVLRTLPGRPSKYSPASIHPI